MFVNDKFVVRKVEKRVYELVEPLVYKGNRDVWVIPAGFPTDYASVPAAVRWLFPQDDDYTIAAILHDAFCNALEGLIELENAPNARDTDAIFRRVMEELGVPFARRWAIWCGVRWGALFSGYRRAGILRDLPLMLELSVALTPLVLPPSLLVLAAKLLESGFNKILGLVGIR